MFSEDGKALGEALQRKYGCLKADIERVDGAIAELRLDYSKKLEALHSEKRNYEEACQHLVALLKLEGHSVTDEELINDNSSSETSVTDDAFDLLDGIHVPLHYRDISERLREQGTDISGVDPAATLLSRISRDERFKRVKRGTYGLKGWRLNTARKKRAGRKITTRKT